MAITKNGALPAAAGVGDVTLTGTQTLTNKTLTSPVVSGLTLSDGSLVLEGATANDFETTIQVTDPTADRTITFPDSTGTVALTSDITVTASSTTTFTNKTINLTSNTVTATLAELNTAISDADVASLAGAETFTNKTLTTPTLNDPKINLAINAQTGTTYTFVLTDNGQVVTASNASSQTYTIPPISSVAFPTGANFTVVRKGAGAVAFAQGSGVTIRSTGATETAPTLRAQYSTATCIHEGSDVWYVVGDIA